MSLAYIILNMGSPNVHHDNYYYFYSTSIICTVAGYEVGMAESPIIATVVSAMLHCDLVSILFGD